MAAIVRHASGIVYVRNWTGTLIGTGASVSLADGSFSDILVTALSNAGAPTITPQGTTGATTYGYKIVARDTLKTAAASAEGTTATGNAALSSTNYNAITWSAVTNAVSYDIYRTTGGATQGKIGNTTGTVLNDTGLVGGGETAPSTNTTGAIQVADGSVSAPGPSFVNDTNTGLHNPGNQLYLTVNGTNRALLDSSGLSLGDVLGLGATVGSSDVFLTRDAANTLALKNGNNDQTQRWYSSSGSYAQITSLNEAHTLTAAGTSDTTITFPASSLGLSTSFRITTTITGCTSVQVGIAGDVTRFGTFSTLTAGQTIAIARADNYTGATAIRFTAVGGGASFTAGAIRTIIHHHQASAPTS